MTSTKQIVSFPPSTPSILNENAGASSSKPTKDVAVAIHSIPATTGWGAAPTSPIAVDQAETGIRSSNGKAKAANTLTPIASSSMPSSSSSALIPSAANGLVTPANPVFPPALSAALAPAAPSSKLSEEEERSLLSRKRQRTEEDHAVEQATRLRIAGLLAADHKAVMNPDVESPFADAADAVRRLLPYHVFHHPEDELQHAICSARRASVTKGKGKEKALDVPPHLEGLALENLETELALDLHQQLRGLQDRFHGLRIREAERTSPIEQVYWLTQAFIESERAHNTNLQTKLREEKLKKEQQERAKRGGYPSAYQPTAAAAQPYPYPVAAASAYPNMAAYANSQAYQTYYQQYAAAMANMTPADIQARAAMYSQMRYPYGTAYPYGAYVGPPGGTPTNLQYAPVAFAPTSYPPSTSSNTATAASTPSASGAPLVVPGSAPITYTPPNTAIPLSLPSAALEMLKASGIIPVSSKDLPHAGQPQPAVVLLGTSPDQSVANVTINLSLLEPEQRGKLSAVLQSLVKTNPAPGG